MKLLWQALATKLRAESTLTDLLDYSTSQPTIYRGYPVKDAKYPCLTFNEISDAWIGDGDLRIHRTFLDFTIYSEDSDKECSDITRAFKNLIVPNTHSFYDITNASVKSYTFQFESESPIISEQTYKTYSKTITASIAWQEL